jgi:hypothetical protein
MPISLSGDYTNPGNIDNAFSSTGGSATGDWFIHDQTMTIYAIRQNIYNTTTSATGSPPVVLNNRLKISVFAQVSREVEYDATFGGSLRYNHELYRSDTAGTEIGLGAEISTSAHGYIRRLVRKDARTGAILDDLTSTTGTLVTSFYMDLGSGEYDGNSSITENEIVFAAANRVNAIFPNFKVSLVSA